MSGDDSHASRIAEQLRMAEDELDEDDEPSTLCGICRTPIKSDDEQDTYRGEPIHGECKGETRVPDGGQPGVLPNECCICDTQFATVEELLEHECTPDDPQAVTDGGHRLPDGFTEFATSSGPAQLRCRHCGERVRRRHLVDRLCPGCRYGRARADGGHRQGLPPRADGGSEECPRCGRQPEPEEYRCECGRDLVDHQRQVGQRGEMRAIDGVLVLFLALIVLVGLVAILGGLM